LRTYPVSAMVLKHLACHRRPHLGCTTLQLYSSTTCGCGPAANGRVGGASGSSTVTRAVTLRVHANPLQSVARFHVDNVLPQCYPVTARHGRSSPAGARSLVADAPESSIRRCARVTKTAPAHARPRLVFLRLCGEECGWRGRCGDAKASTTQRCPSCVRSVPDLLVANTVARPAGAGCATATSPPTVNPRVIRRCRCDHCGVTLCWPGHLHHLQSQASRAARAAVLSTARVPRLPPDRTRGSIAARSSSEKSPEALLGECAANRQQSSPHDLFLLRIWGIQGRSICSRLIRA